MKIWKVLFSFIVIFIFTGCGVKEGSAKKPVYKDGEKIELTSVVGSKITLLRKNGGFVLEGDESKILILDIFGTFCVTCQKEASNIMNFQLKNSEDVFLIGFTYLESVTDKYVVDNFTRKFNAYYFIVNSPDNDKIVNTITQDIDYKPAVQIPFKVVLKDGAYQNITDIYESSLSNKFYIGAIETDIIKKDIEKIKAQ
ncbi:MAG: TlpA family protein disulfide reductase [Sulfurospirillum sp.]|nr:TlpA family protein disulfide reductase [Sulfurospirillum sp.]MBL0703814.1 TlpA family protein disulfide reductase [Sulfurospirillum sp.]